MNGEEQVAVAMTGVQPAIILLAGVIFVSLIIERLLEILKAWYDYLEAKHNWYNFWNISAEKIQGRIEIFLKDQQSQNATSRLGFERLKVEEPAYKYSFTISVEVLRRYTIKYIAKMLGIVLGIGVALLADIDLFQVIEISIYGDDADPGKFPILAKIATGVAMGLGAGPVHKIIAALEKAKKRRTKTS